VLLQAHARMAEVMLDLELGANDEAWQALEAGFAWAAQLNTPPGLAAALEAEL